MNDRFLVTGAEGAIGRALALHLERAGGDVYRASRDPEPTPRNVKLELSDLGKALDESGPLDRIAADGKLTAFLMAGITGFRVCESDPAGARRINVESTRLLARHLLRKAAFVVFPSTSSVFSGTLGRSTEDRVPDPLSEYARQKSETETLLRDELRTAPSQAGLAIVRLTKVVSAEDGLISQWLTAMTGGSEIEAATDLIFSPISMDFVVRGLAVIGRLRQSGTFHLSGDRDVSYFQFAAALARLLGKPEALVRPVEIRDRLGPGLAPARATLDMAATARVAGLAPQTVEEAAADLVLSAGRTLQL